MEMSFFSELILLEINVGLLIFRHHEILQSYEGYPLMI